MKRTILVLCILLVAIGISASGRAEAAEEKIHELILVDTGTTPWHVAPGLYDSRGYDSFQELLLGDFLEDNPNIRVTHIHRDVTQGSMTTDALFARGTPPDVWLDAAGYFRDLLNAEHSLPLEQYMDVSIYQDHLLAPYTVDGHVYAIPMANIATGMAVNLKMLDEIGYTQPAHEDWTTDEFLQLAEQLKQAGYHATMITTQQGMIAWQIVWLYAFGAELFADGDYSRVAINTPEAAAGLDYMKLLVDRGYAPPYPNELTDDDAVELFTTGRVFSSMMQNGHTDYWIPEQVSQGVIDEAFDHTFWHFPHAPGRENTPVFGYQTIVNARRSDDEERNQAVVKLLQNRTGVEYQTYGSTLQGAFPTLKDFDIPNIGTAAKPSFQAVAEIAPVAGLMDLGGLHPRAREVRDAWKIPVQQFMDGEISAQEVLDQFEAEANKILAR